MNVSGFFHIFLFSLSFVCIAVLWVFCGRLSFLQVAVINKLLDVPVYTCLLLPHHSAASWTPVCSSFVVRLLHLLVVVWLTIELLLMLMLFLTLCFYIPSLMSNLLVILVPYLRSVWLRSTQHKWTPNTEPSEYGCQEANDGPSFKLQPQKTPPPWVKGHQINLVIACLGLCSASWVLLTKQSREFWKTFGCQISFRGSWTFQMNVMWFEI